MASYEQLVQIGYSVALIVVGAVWVAPYFAKMPIIIPGETMNPGEKPWGRLFVMLLGSILVGWGVWRLVP